MVRLFISQLFGIWLFLQFFNIMNNVISVIFDKCEKLFPVNIPKYYALFFSWKKEVQVNLSILK